MSIKLIIFFVLLIVSQQIINYSHIRYMTQEYNMLIKAYSGLKGYVIGYGKENAIFRKLKPGKIYLIVIDDENIIIDARVLQGFTVLSKFSQSKILLGKNINEIQDKRNMYDSSLVQAVNNVVQFKKEK